MKALFASLLLGMCTLPVLAQDQPLIIDDFDDEAFTDAGLTGIFSEIDAMGGEREVDNTGSTFAAFTSEGFLVSTMDFFESVRLVYDGSDGVIEAFQHEGLGGLDFAGTSDGIVVYGILPQSSGVSISIALYTDSESASWASRTVGALFDPTDVTIPFSTFNPLLGEGVDFSNIGAVEIVIASNGQTQVQIDAFGLNDTPLPVELTSFTGLIDGSDIVLSWETASETNNAGFDIDHKAPGSAEFQHIAFEQGRGTTDMSQRYAYRVQHPGPGRHVFRLKQIDFDGAFAYSDEVYVDVLLDDLYELTAAYPNPFNPQTTFSLTLGRAQHVRIRLYDALGRQVADLHDGPLEANQPHRFTIDGAGLSNGMYWYAVEGAYFQDGGRVLLAK